MELGIKVDLQEKVVTYGCVGNGRDSGERQRGGIRLLNGGEGRWVDKRKKQG